MDHYIFEGGLGNFVTIAITLANHKGHRQSCEPIKTHQKTRDGQKARENVRKRVTIGFGFSSDWVKKWCKILNQSLSVVMHNQSKRKLITVKTLSRENVSI